ncbi:hypothetical protein [Streptomyces malaysiensis]|uniref:hypothetical protein n=1 Tax=Streptomyces malaysiensis TaxID=92644 RepID=UPI0036CFC0EF
MSATAVGRRVSPAGEASAETMGASRTPNTGSSRDGPPRSIDGGSSDRGSR